MHSHLAKGHISEFSFIFSLIFNSLGGFIGGILCGLLLWKVNRRIRSKPYIHGLWWGTAGFIVIVSFMFFLTAIAATIYFHGWDCTDPEFITHLKVEAGTTLHLKNILFWGTITLFTQFYLQISQKFGPGNLWNILTGKYHIPKSEKRIFMFLDLKPSTTIAEKLGESKYHEFLQNIFADITDPITYSKAEIYQYVGDEVIITWDLENIKEKPDCLSVFFEIENEFEKNKEKYLSKFNTLPKFKAGAHIGHAIVGEIGIIKRDITYSGDLLNTTARIQGQCNDLNARLLISKQLKEYLNIKKDWAIQSKGFISLKGKEEEIELFCVEQIQI